MPNTKCQKCKLYYAEQSNAKNLWCQNLNTEKAMPRTKYQNFFAVMVLKSLCRENHAKKVMPKTLCQILSSTFLLNINLVAVFREIRKVSNEILEVSCLNDLFWYIEPADSPENVRDSECYNFLSGVLLTDFISGWNVFAL